MRTFGATNEKGTCLWCGRKLKENTDIIGIRADHTLRRKRNGTFGVHDGLFCTRTCAEFFGLTLAKAGRRLKASP